MSETKVSQPILRRCKRGHLRTKESTFERKSRQGDKVYICRECRICHAMKTNRTPSWSKGRSNSKWRRFERETANA